MAQVVLVAAIQGANLSAGVAFFATIAAAVAGSYVDNQIFNDDIAPSDEYRPHLPQQQIASEGGPSLFIIGQEAVVQGQVIWMDDIDDGDPNNPFVHVAVAFANHEVFEVKRIFSRNVDVYDAREEDTWTSTTASLELRAFAIDSVVWIKEPSTSSNKLNTKAVGRDNTWEMTGWANQVNNYTETGSYPPVTTPVTSPADQRGVCTDAFTISGGTTVAEVRRQISARYYDANAIPPNQVYYWVNPPKPETASGTLSFKQTFDKVNTNLVDAVEVFTGEQDQPLSQLMVTHQPDPYHGGRGGLAYFTLEKFRLRDFGRVFPSDMQVVASTSATPVRLADAFTAIIETYHGSPVRYRTDLDATIVRGYGMRGNLSIAKRLEPLMLAYDVVAQVDRGEVRFLHPEDASIHWIPETDFLEPLTFSTVSDIGLPTSVTVQFTDGENELYEMGAVTEHVSNHPNPNQHKSENHTTIDLRAVTMMGTEAEEVAKRKLWRPRMRRTKVVGRTTRRWSHLKEWDGFETSVFRDDGETKVDVILSKVETGANGEVEFEGFVLEKKPLGVV